MQMSWEEGRKWGEEGWMRGKIVCGTASEPLTVQMGSDCASRRKRVCVCVSELSAPVSGTDTQAWRRWSTPLPCCRAAWSESRYICNNHQLMTAADLSRWMTGGWSLFLGKTRDQYLLIRMKSSRLLHRYKNIISHTSHCFLKSLHNFSDTCITFTRLFYFTVSLALLLLPWNLHSRNDGDCS